MYQLHNLRANGPLFVGDKLSATYPVMMPRRARPTAARPPRSSPCIAKFLDTVVALPSVHRPYQREGITDEIC
jgi:glutathione S-transferase